MGKMVRYNGETMSFTGCSDPERLEVGKVYEVIGQSVGKYQTDYTLRGVRGEFNSVWFDEVDSTKTFMGIAYAVPVVGKRFCCSVITTEDRHFDLVDIKSSKVKNVCHLGNQIYQVTTCNSLYLIKVVI